MAEPELLVDEADQLQHLAADRLARDAEGVADLLRVLGPLTEAEIAINRVSRMAQDGVDLSPQALDAMAETRRRSDTRLLFGAALLMLLAAWLFK